MEDIRIFLNDQGLTQKEIAVYLGCLKQGDGTVLQIAKQAQVKRPTAYLILEDLVRRGFVNSKKDKRSIHYFPTHPKRILTRLKNQLQTAESVMPQIMSLYNDSSERPSVAIYEDMAGYEQTGEIVFDAVKRGVEYMYYGTVHFWVKETPEASDKWFKLMRNKKHKAKILVYGWGDHEKEYVHRTKSLGNPNVQVRVIKDPFYPVDTEQAITDDTVILFTGGNNFSSVVIRSQKMAATFKTTFLQLWSLAEEPTM